MAEDLIFAINATSFHAKNLMSFSKHQNGTMKW